MSDNEFEKGDANSSLTEFAEAGRRKNGSLIMMKEVFPCRVTDLSTAKPGKHGSAKAMVVAKDIFTMKQYEETFGTGDMIPVPIVTKIEYQCLDCDEDGVLQLLTSDGDVKEDISLPSESHLKDLEKTLRGIIEAGKVEALVTIQKWGEREQMVGVREGQEM